MESIEPKGENSEPVAEPKEEAPAEAERPLTATSVETHRLRHPLGRWLVWVVTVVILTILIILLARWIYHATHHNSKPVSSTSQKTPAASSQNKNSGNQKSSNSNSSSNSGSNSSSSNSQITNTGPGDTMAIFIAASAVAGGAHYIVRRRRAKLM